MSGLLHPIFLHICELKHGYRDLDVHLRVRLIGHCKIIVPSCVHLLSHKEASDDGLQFTKVAPQDLMEAMLSLQTQVEEMRREIQVLRKELASRETPLRMTTGNTQADRPTVGMFYNSSLNIQLDYYPNRCDDLKGYNLPTGFYKVQSDSSPSSQDYDLCKF